MCGINGILNYNGHPVYREELERFNSEMVHRGPDDEGYYVNENIGLSIRRLSIIDVHGGHQPISSEDGRYWVVLNGEIYNYLELRQELEKKGHRFSTKTDTEVLVHLYEDLGEKCLEKLNGMFAFAIWDSLKKELFIATDRLGIKPLFYHNSGSRFCFSSELKSLLTLDVERQIDYGSYLLYLFLLYVPYPRSIIKNIQKLEPATCLKINAKGEVLKRTYWNVKDFNAVEKIDEQEFKEIFLSLLSDAIKLQLRSDVPVGTFLSGGIDSSCVVAMLSRLGNGDPVRTFSVGYEGHHIDERPYARQVAEMYNTEHTEYFLNGDDVRRKIRQIVWYMDEPIGDSAALPTFLLSEMAGQSGVKVILNGTGGDEIFGGYRRYLKNGIKDTLYDESRALTNIVQSVIQKPASINTALKLKNPITEYLCQFNSGMGGIRRYLKDDFWYDMLLNELENVFSDRFHALDYLPKVDRLMRFDQISYLSGNLLFLLDKMTMGSSIEGRVPLIDHRMVEFMATIPARLKIGNGDLKSLVKKALKGILSDEILYREKMGFGGPVSYWLSNNMLDECEVLWNDVSPVTDELFRSTGIIQAIKAGKYNQRNAQFFYSVAIFELWYKDVFKGVGAD